MSDQAIGQKASQILAQYGQNAAVITYDQLKRILGFASGGYTGAWGSNGKIAMLHEKELVLNKKDTENMLDAVNLLRTFSVSEIADSIIGAAKTSASILASVTSKASQAVAGISNNQTNNYRDMTINADFSGVKSADAIYQALTELSNYGMQEAYSNSPLANKSY
jgi:glycerate kinase